MIIIGQVPNIFSVHYSPMELCSGEARMFRARSRLGMVWRSTRREGDLHQSQLSSAIPDQSQLT